MFLGRHSQGPCSPVRWLADIPIFVLFVGWEPITSLLLQPLGPLTVCRLWAMRQMWSDIYNLLISGLGAALNCSSTVRVI